LARSPPAKRISPLVAVCSPVSTRAKVDLPDPDSPMMARMRLGSGSCASGAAFLGGRWPRALASRARRFR
jgi:hypothetical protein